LRWLDDASAGVVLAAEFASLHVQLRRDASQQAATAVNELLKSAVLVSRLDI
jgi:hypothetical protein